MVTGRPLERVSASQISLYQSCERAWALRYLAGVKGPQKTYQVTGTETHAEVEQYLKTGVLPASGHPHRTKVVAASAHLVRALGQCVEHHITWPMWEGGPTMVGYVDQVKPPWWEDTPDGRLLVAGITDHKTTSDFKWAKTPDELRTNTQLIIYAYWLYRAFHLPILFPVPPMPEWRDAWAEGLDLVELEHVYVKTKNVERTGKAMPVRTRVDWPHVAAQWARIEAAVEEMNALSLATPAHTITNDDARAHLVVQSTSVCSDGAACEAYGGCDYGPRKLGICGGAAASRLSDELYQISNLFGNSTPASGEETMSTTSDLQERLKARMAGKSTPAEAPAPAPAPAAPPATAPTPPATPAAVLPPDAPPRTDGPAPSPTPTPNPVSAAPAAAPKRGKAVKPAAPVTPPAEPAAAPTAPASPPATHAEATPPAPNSAPSIPTPSPSPPRPAGPSAIYYGCAPGVGPHAGPDNEMAWERWMSALVAEVCRIKDVSDYRLIEFGKGKGFIAHAIRANLHTAPTVCVVRRGHPEADEFLAIAVPVCPHVVFPR